MAIVWGAYVHASGGYGMRIGIETTMTPVTHASKSSTATYKVYTQNDGTWDPPDRQVIEFDGNYNLPEQYEFDNVGTSATNGDVIHRVTKTYTYVYGPNTYGTTALPQEADLVADVIHTRPLYYPHVEVHIPFPVRPYGTPAVPTAIGVSRVSDTSNKIVWNCNPTVGEPYTAVWLERYIYNYATWARIATLGATVETYSDTGAIPNRKYTYRVQADNTVGTSAYVQAAAAIYTTPAAPTVPVRAESAGNQVLTWALAVGYTEYQTEVWRSDNGTWALLTTLASGVTTYTDTTASVAVRTKYRFRTKTSSGTVLYSAYSAETTETTGIPTAPSAPTNLKPVTTTIDPTGAIIHTWTHHPTDGGLQTFFEVQYRHVGAPTWNTTGKIASSVSTWTMPKNSVSKGNQVEWQVRTWGWSPDLVSPWSASAIWTTSPAIPLKWPMYLDVDTGQVEANSHVTLISEQTRRVATVSRTTATTTTTAPYNICTYTIPATLARSGKKFRITAGCNLIPDTAGMFTDLRIYVGVGAVTTGTYIGAYYVDHRIASRSVGGSFVTEWTFDPVVAGGENISTINIAFVAVPGSGGSLVNQSVNRPAFLIIDEIIEGSSTAGGGGGSGVPPGGTDGQVLTKISDVDGDADWEDSQGGSGLAVVEPTYAAARKCTTSQSIPTGGSPTIISFDTETFNAGIPWESTPTPLFRIPVDGYYQVDTAITFGTNVTGARVAYIYVNGGAQVQAFFAQSSRESSAVASATVKCVAGDYVTIRVYQNSGVALALTPTDQQNMVTIHKVPTLSPGGGGVVVERPVAAMRRNVAGTSLLHNTVIAIPFDTEVYEEGGLTWSAADSAFIAPSDGYYRVEFGLTYALTNTTGVRVAYPSLNGSSTAVIQDEGTVGAVAGSTTIKAAAGDKISLRSQQTSGVTLPLVTAANYNWVSVTKLPAAYAGSAVSTYGERIYAASRRHAGGLSLPAGQIVYIPFNTEDYADGIPFSGDTFTIPVTGYYQIDASIRLATAGTGHDPSIGIVVNGTASVGGLPVSGSVASVGISALIARTLKLNAGDLVQIRAGSTLANSLATSAFYNWVNITKVPAPVVNGAAASGVWGAGNLAPAKVGTSDLAGREVYIDSKGQLRSAPLRLDTPHISKNKTVSQNLTAASTFYTVIFEEDMQPPVGITYSGGVFTVPEDGIYHLDLALLFGGPATSQTRISITCTNPSEAAVNYGQPAWNGQGNSMGTYSRAIRLKAGATLTIAAYANATGHNVTGSSSNYTSMSLVKIAA